MRTPDIRRQKVTHLRAHSDCLMRPFSKARLVALENCHLEPEPVPSCWPSAAPWLREAPSKPGSQAMTSLTPRDQNSPCGELTVACSPLWKGQGFQSPSCSHHIFLALEGLPGPHLPHTYHCIDFQPSPSCCLSPGRHYPLKLPVHPQTLPRIDRCLRNGCGHSYLLFFLTVKGMCTLCRNVQKLYVK